MMLADELVAEGDREGARSAVDEALGGGEKDGLGLSVLRKDGGEVSVSADVGPRRDGSSVTGSMVLARKD